MDNFMGDYDRKSISMFFRGFSVAILIMSMLLASGLINEETSLLDEDEIVSKEEIGNKTIDTINRRILHNTPNNVTGKLLRVEESGYGLENFYRVDVEVVNPTTTEPTSVWVKKDGEVFFLNNPRYFDRDLYRSQNHE